MIGGIVVREVIVSHDLIASHVNYHLMAYQRLIVNYQLIASNQSKVTLHLIAVGNNSFNHQLVQRHNACWLAADRLSAYSDPSADY